MTVVITDNAATTLNKSLLEHQFWQSPSDEHWYPVSRSEARARIKIEGGMYTIQTRHTLEQPWTLLVRALVSDFDPVTFHRWCDEWPLQLT